ncbi:MAG TPA: helix-turn-helix transcriptional regulator [Cyclobacteriaceae bacterium]|nr:helix-turn-helix transcriptional regulator [Cyclobacteriaceae bacterium]
MAKAPAKKSKKRSRLMKLQYRAQVLATFGQRLKSLRLKKGFTLRQFEVRSGIDAGNLAKYERGTREPGLIVILIMARALDMHYQELLDFKFDFEETTLRRSAQL